MTLPALTGEADLERLLTLPDAVVYKHSSRCPFSSWAHDQVARFAAAHPNLPVVLVDVIIDRVLSLTIAERLGVPHESPQALVLRGGSVAWHGSHGAVRADTLARALS